MPPKFEQTFGTDRAKVAQHIFDSGRRLLGMADAQLKAVTSIGGKTRWEAGFQLIAHGSLLRVWQLLGCSLDIFAGLQPRVCLILNRSVFEVNLTLVYIRRDQRRRVGAFLRYSAVQRFQLLEAARKNRKHLGAKYKTISKEARRKIIKEFLEVKSRFPNAFRWSSKSIRKMATIVDARAFYDFHYASYSDEAHGLPLSIDRTFDKRSDGTLILRADFVPGETLESMHRTIDWANQVAAIHADEFDKAKLPLLKAERDRLNALPA